MMKIMCKKYADTTYFSFFLVTYWFLLCYFLTYFPLSIMLTFFVTKWHSASKYVFVFCTVKTSDVNETDDDNYSNDISNNNYNNSNKLIVSPKLVISYNYHH